MQVDINDPEFDKKLRDIYVEYGVAIITNVFTEKECIDHISNILTCFEKLGTGIDRNNIKKTWTDFNNPMQTRPGLYQCLMSNLPTVWEIRSNKNIRRIFTSIYSSLRNKEVNDFVVSNDGINFRPHGIGPYHEDGKDWAHIDQATKSDPFICVQGQAVLTTSTAAFVASPKSHKLYDQILKYHGIDNYCGKGDFLMMRNNVDEIKKLVEDIGGKWQIPILVEKGSFIIWASTTIHSAKLENKPDGMEANKNLWENGRCVIYVCYRPRSDFTEQELRSRLSVVKDNRTTNHWGTHIFPKKPGRRFLKDISRHKLIEEYLDEPKKVYDKIGYPKLNKEQLRLAGANI